MPMDKIFLRELEIDAVIGIWEWERQVKQKVSIDLEIGTDVRGAALTDAVDGTVITKMLRSGSSILLVIRSSNSWSRLLMRLLRLSLRNLACPG